MMNDLFLRALAAQSIQRLPTERRREAITAAISLLPLPPYAAVTEAWLRELAAD